MSLQVISHSFYSKPLYRDAAQNWKGFALGVIALVSLLYSIALVIYLHRSFVDFSENIAPTIIEKMPTMSFKGGKMATNVTQPYFVYGPEETTQDKRIPIAIFDNTGTYHLENLYAGQILVTDRFFHARKQSGEISSFDFAKFPDGVVDHGALYDFMSTARKWFLPVMFPILLLGVLAYRVIQAMTYGAIGLILNRLMQSYLEYTQLVRIAVVAAIPLAVADAATLLFNIPLNLGWFATLITLGYMVFGIRSNKELIS